MSLSEIKIGNIEELTTSMHPSPVAEKFDLKFFLNVQTGPFPAPEVILEKKAIPEMGACDALLVGAATYLPDGTRNIQWVGLGPNHHPIEEFFRGMIDMARLASSLPGWAGEFAKETHEKALKLIDEHGRKKG